MRLSVAREELDVVVRATKSRPSILAAEGLVGENCLCACPGELGPEFRPRFPIGRPVLVWPCFGDNSDVRQPRDIRALARRKEPVGEDGNFVFRPNSVCHKSFGDFNTLWGGDVFLRKHPAVYGL